MVETLISEDLQNKLMEMIRVHERAFGKKPEVLDVPRPEVSFMGVRVSFNIGNHYASCDREHALHHEWAK